MSRVRSWRAVLPALLLVAATGCDTQSPAPPPPTAIGISSPAVTLAAGTAAPATRLTSLAAATATALPANRPTATLLPANPSATSTPHAIASAPSATPGPGRRPVTGAGGTELMQALAAMDAVPSYRYSLQLTLGLTATRLLLTGRGQYATPDSFDTNFRAGGFTSEVLETSGNTYVRAYGVWHKGPPDAVAFPLLPPPDVKNVIGLVGYAGSATVAGSGDEVLDGQPVRHLRFTLDNGGLQGPAGAGDLGTAGGDLLIDRESRRFRRLSYIFGRAGSTGDNDGTLQIDFSDYDAAVTIAPPALPAPTP